MTTATRLSLIRSGNLKPAAPDGVKADPLAVEARKRNMRGARTQRALDILQEAQARRIITYVKAGVRREQWL